MRGDGRTHTLYWGHQRGYWWGMGTNHIDGGISILSILSILSYIKSDLVVRLSITVQYSIVMYCIVCMYIMLQYRII